MNEVVRREIVLLKGAKYTLEIKGYSIEIENKSSKDVKLKFASMTGLYKIVVKDEEEKRRQHRRFHK